MSKVTRNALLAVSAIIMLGIAGRCDYNEAVINSMDESVYKCIKSRYPWYGESKIADEYQSNKTYWIQTAKEYELLNINY